jgi:DNA-binding MarR family transcriptional regulator
VTPAPSQPDPARSAWEAMRTFVLERNDRRGEVSAQLGMSFIRVKALGKLAAAPLPMRDLAALLAVDAPYTTVVVDDLEARGLVQRQLDPDDRRRKIVAVTPAGRRLARRARELLDDPPPEVSKLAAEDLADLDRIMQRLLAAEPSPGPSKPAGRS